VVKTTAYHLMPIDVEIEHGSSGGTRRNGILDINSESQDSMVVIPGIVMLSKMPFLRDSQGNGFPLLCYP